MDDDIDGAVRVGASSATAGDKSARIRLPTCIPQARSKGIGDETRTLHHGDAYSVPPHLPHGGRTHGEGCVVLDVFTLVREDYAALARVAQ